MKTATVPAQITTVEDKIAGNLTLKQMIILAVPVFVDFGIYAMFPSWLKLSAYKIVLMLFSTIAIDLLALRVKGKIILVWLSTLIRYNNRAQFFVFNKNHGYLRDSFPLEDDGDQLPEMLAAETLVKKQAHLLKTEDINHLNKVMQNPMLDLSFAATKRGGLRVNVSQVK